MNFEPLLQRPLQPGIAEAARYLQELATGRELPMRRDFRPSHVRSIHGYIFLIDVLPDDYRFSLTGEHVSVLFGVEGTGALLSTYLPEAHRDRLKKTYDQVVASRTYQYVRGRYAWSDRSVTIERLLVPMADQDGRLNSILGMSVPVDVPKDELNIFVGIGIAALEIDEQVTGAL